MNLKDHQNEKDIEIITLPDNKLQIFLPPSIIGPLDNFLMPRTPNLSININNIHEPDRTNFTFASKLEYLGSGGFSKVYRYRGDLNNKAVKKIVADPKYYSKKLTAEDSIKREVYGMTKVNCPNSLKVYGVYQNEAKDNFYILMELCDGNIEDYIKTRGYPLNIYEIIILLFQLNKAFYLLDRYNIIHRDIKPSNILYKEEKDIDPHNKRINKKLFGGKKLTFKIGDYGVCIPLYDQKFSKSQFMGTLDFMAPEIYEMKCEKEHPVFTKKIDLFSLGQSILCLMGFIEKASTLSKAAVEELKKTSNLFNGNRKEKLLADLVFNYLLVFDVEKRADWKIYFKHPLFEDDLLYSKYENKVKAHKEDSIRIEKRLIKRNSMDNPTKEIQKKNKNSKFSVTSENIENKNYNSNNNNNKGGNTINKCNSNINKGGNTINKCNSNINRSNNININKSISNFNQSINIINKCNSNIGKINNFKMNTNKSINDINKYNSNINKNNNSNMNIKKNNNNKNINMNKNIITNKSINNLNKSIHILNKNNISNKSEKNMNKSKYNKSDKNMNKINNKYNKNNIKKEHYDKKIKDNKIKINKDNNNKKLIEKNNLKENSFLSEKNRKSNIIIKNINKDYNKDKKMDNNNREKDVMYKKIKNIKIFNPKLEGIDNRRQKNISINKDKIYNIRIPFDTSNYQVEKQLTYFNPKIKPLISNKGQKTEENIIKNYKTKFIINNRFQNMNKIKNIYLNGNRGNNSNNHIISNSSSSNIKNKGIIFTNIIKKNSEKNILNVKKNENNDKTNEKNKFSRVIIINDNLRPPYFVKNKNKSNFSISNNYINNKIATSHGSFFSVRNKYKKLNHKDISINDNNSNFNNERRLKYKNNNCNMSQNLSPKNLYLYEDTCTCNCRNPSINQLKIYTNNSPREEIKNKYKYNIKNSNHSPDYRTSKSLLKYNNRYNTSYIVTTQINLRNQENERNPVKNKSFRYNDYNNYYYNFDDDDNSHKKKHFNNIRVVSEKIEENYRNRIDRNNAFYFSRYSGSNNNY